LDFGTGWSGDIGCHIFSAPWKGLELKAPVSIQARINKSWLESPELRAQLWARANHITWEFPGNDLTVPGQPLTVEWFDGVEPDFYIPEEFRKLQQRIQRFVLGYHGCDAAVAAAAIRAGPVHFRSSSQP